VKNSIWASLTIIFITGIGIFPFAVSGQNCGTISSWSRKTDSSGTAGNTIYTFTVNTAPASGGTKCVDLSIQCVATGYVFVSGKYSAPAGGTAHTLGPYDVTTCSGAITLTYTGWTTSTCNGGTSCTSVTLPVDFLSFQANRVKGGVQLHWKTSLELNNMGFIVEKTVNGVSWDSIGWVPGIGNSNEINSYAFLDEKEQRNKVYYRLKQIDFDGKFEYSSVVFSTPILSNRIVISPNPVADVMYFSESELDVKVKDGTGREIRTFKITNATVDISDLTTGLYILEISYDGQITYHRIIKK
jgi:hypothetical protein